MSYREAATYIKVRTPLTPRVGVILGSGLGPVLDEISATINIPYSDIPHFPVPSVEGHAGRLVIGEIAGVPVAVMKGRAHFYEGRKMGEVVFPVRVLHELGARVLVATCSAGGISEGLGPGALMAVSDHINLIGANPLSPGDGCYFCDGKLSERSEFLPAQKIISVPRLREDIAEGRDRFVDMTDAYDPALIAAAVEAGRGAGIKVGKGVLAAMPGPSYETPAEIRMLKVIGADAVSMSTVPEVIMARCLGMRVLAVALITNRAAGLSDKGPEHSEVLKEAGEAGGRLGGILKSVIAGLT